MNIYFEKLKGILIVHLEGRIGSGNASQVEEILLAQEAVGDSDVLVDMTQLEHISGAGIRVAMRVAKRLSQAGGVLVLYGMQPQIKEVFDLSGFSAMLTVARTRADAIEYFEQLD